MWRNYGILIAFFVFFNAFYLAATEFRSGTESKAETLIFRPRNVPKYLLNDDSESNGTENVAVASQEESSEGDVHLADQQDVFHWKNLCYDIPVKEGTRRLLDNVNGWVKPRTLTALMVGK
jgi:hypothetical protein